MKVLRINETIQAGDTTLLKYNCPICYEQRLTAFPVPACNCREDFKEYEVVLPKHRKNKRLLVGTRRKGRITKNLVRQLFEEAGGTCAYCSITLTTQYEVEHIVPISAGGSSLASNLTLSCQTCNRIAGSKVFNTLSAKRAYILNQRKAA